MTNPFDYDEDATYVVVLNNEDQYSLWPRPSIVHPADSRKACLDFISRNWTDMRPKSLRDR
jgi:MbtH protein